MCRSFTVPPGILPAPVSQADIAARDNRLVPRTKAPDPMMPFSTSRRLTFATWPGAMTIGSKMWVMAYTPVEARRTAAAMR